MTPRGGFHIYLKISSETFKLKKTLKDYPGIDFLTELHAHPYWKQTSFNGNFRGQYASPGFVYNADLDIF